MAEKETKLDAVTCTLKATDIDTLLRRASSQLDVAPAGSEARAVPELQESRRLQEATAAVVNLIRLQEASSAHSRSPPQKAFRHCRPHKAATTGTTEKNAERLPAAASIHVFRSDWKDGYKAWYEEVTADAARQPYDKQWQVLNEVHKRCLVEEAIERSGADIRQRQSAAPDPLFKLVHGLPGSGKSQIIKWLRRYFELVWHWESGVHFQFVAPLNSMASGIGGSTLHSWAEITWEDKRGRKVRSHGGMPLVPLLNDIPNSKHTRLAVICSNCPLPLCPCPDSRFPPIVLTKLQRVHELDSHTQNN